MVSSFTFGLSVQAVPVYTFKVPVDLFVAYHGTIVLQQQTTKLRRSLLCANENAFNLPWLYAKQYRPCRPRPFKILTKLENSQ